MLVTSNQSSLRFVHLQEHFALSHCLPSLLLGKVCISGETKMMQKVLPSTLTGGFIQEGDPVKLFHRGITKRNFVLCRVRRRM